MRQIGSAIMLLCVPEIQRKTVLTGPCTRSRKKLRVSATHEAMRKRIESERRPGTMPIRNGPAKSLALGMQRIVRKFLRNGDSGAKNTRKMLRLGIDSTTSDTRRNTTNMLVSAKTPYGLTKN